jgi:2-polyprenyl-3-methyl-5-hydroxy-6-metoxy-1,4-benzoquinol methylase
LPDITWIESALDIVLHHIPKNIESMIDVGCGRGIVGAIVRIYRDPKRVVGVDVFKPYLDFCEKMGSYTELLQWDLRTLPLPFDDNEFDLAVALEVLEHMPKTKGLFLVKELERIAKRIIISTPTIFFSQSLYDGNRFQKHISIWHYNEFKQKGYIVRGVGGLRLPAPRSKYCRKISYALGRLTYLSPILSTSIIAIKSKDKA